MKSSDEKWLDQLTSMAASSSMVDSSLYAKYDVKRGLRDLKAKACLRA